MSNFNGISAKALELLAENRYHDSKNYYEAHKEELKQLATIPLRQIVMELSDTLLGIDEQMYVDPVYTVSRIRRDTRYTKDKTLYRENLWIMFRRNKAIYRNCPFMWFEISPQSYDVGIALFTEKPRYMDVFRRAVRSRPDEFRMALKATKQAKLNFCGDLYIKQKAENEGDEFALYLNAKNIQFMKYNTDLSRLQDDRIIRELKKIIMTIRPMYEFLLSVHNEIEMEDK